jgi:uncharacterized protein (DUF302 family)
MASRLRGMSYAISTTVAMPYADAVEATRKALADQGFGVLTEIDLSRTLKEKIDADIEPQVILGACRPPLAHAAVQAEPSIGLLLPCNVVVRRTGDNETIVEALDPQVMVTMTGNPALGAVADDAAQRLKAALDSLS